MKAISSELLADLKAGLVATVLLVERADGVVFGYTDRDNPLEISGQVYVPAPGISGIKVTLNNSAQVGSQSVRAAWVPSMSDSDIVAGLYDSATVKLGFASWKNPSYGVLWFFAGALGTIQRTADGFEATAQSALWVLQRPLGISTTPTCRHQLFSTLDPQGVWGCQLSAAPYTYSGTISSMANAMSWTVDIANWQNALTPNTPTAPSLSVQSMTAGQYLPPGEYHYSVSSIDAHGQESSPSPIASVVVQPNQGGTGGGVVNLSWNAVPGAVSYNVYGNTVQQLLMNTAATSWTDNGSSGSGGLPPLHGDYFAGGIVTMTSGAAAGLKADVLTMKGTTLQLLLPLGKRPSPGDAFTITPGCSKSAQTCQYKFSNIVNFGGFPDLSPQRQWM
jgi:hypothetical protein